MRQDPSVIEFHLFLKRPTQRLDYSALDLVSDAVGIDDLPTVISGDRSQDANTSVTSVNFDLDGDRNKSCQVFVPSEGDAATTVFFLLIAGPTEFLRACREYVARSRVLEKAKAVS